MKIVIYAVNTVLATCILFLGWSANDKVVIVAYSLYVVLFALNIMFGLFAQMDSKPVYKYYYLSGGAIALVGIIAQILT